MSFAVHRNFRQLNLISCRRWEIRVLSKFFIHCTSKHRQSDGGEKPNPTLVGPPDTPKSIAKQDLISRAMKTYLERKQKSDDFLNTNIEEFDLGKRHLANIMGMDEDEMTTEKIREAIEYLLPSGLFNKKARPLMEHPTFYLPQQKGQEFDTQGRPKHYLYYTFKPAYFEVMHDMALKLENLKKMTTGSMTALRDPTRSGAGFEWIGYEQFVKQFPGESITTFDHKRFLVLIQRLDEHPLGLNEKEFIDQYRVILRPKSETMTVPQPKRDAQGRDYIIKNGKRKTSKATVKLFSNGHGNININGQDITYFTEVIHRQAVLSPLQLCGVLDKFDFEARVSGTGPSADAGAIRLALSRALLTYMPLDMREQLRIAGYLTTDPRKRERKKPGQEGARRKFTWKKR